MIDLSLGLLLLLLRCRFSSSKIPRTATQVVADETNTGIIDLYRLVRAHNVSMPCIPN